MNISGFSNLRLLSLDGNELTHVTNHMMISLDKLQNRIELLTLKSEYLNLLNVKKDRLKVDLRNNPLSCTCELLDFVQWIQQTMVALVGRDELICYSYDNIVTSSINALMF